MVSYGIYEPFDKQSKELPQIVDFTTTIPARLGVEFGYILSINKARGMTLQFIMEHPPFPNSKGQIAPPFEGEEFVRHNEYRFFLGDTFWLPLEDKVGPWRLITMLEGEVIADKTFNIIPDETANS